jgi:hypothetical protein
MLNFSASRNPEVYIMPWKKTAIGDESCWQDTTMGCPFACIATVVYWLTGKQHDESDLRNRLTGHSTLWAPKKDAMTGGLNLDTASALLSALAIQSESFEGLTKDSFQQKMKEASSANPLLVGITWLTNDKHLVVCAGPASNGKVWIFDPANGLAEHPIDPIYKQGSTVGLFDLKALRIVGNY